MIAGHAALGFLIAALAAYHLDVEPDKCLVIGFFAAAFAALPDIDLVFASGEILTIFSSGSEGFINTFWSASESFHRGITHNLLALLVSSVAFAYYREKNDLKTAMLMLSLLSVFGLILNNLMSFMIMVVFSLAGILITYLSVDYIEKNGFRLALFTGLLSHPFGDVFTGVPPDFFFPLGLNLLESRIVLNQDPVLNLISILLLELLILFLAVLTAIMLKEEDLRSHLTPAPLLGMIYIPLYFIVPEPTLSSAYIFVFLAVSLGFIANFLTHLLNGTDSEGHIINLHSLNFVLTFILASFSYAAAYLLF